MVVFDGRFWPHIWPTRFSGLTSTSLSAVITRQSTRSKPYVVWDRAEWSVALLCLRRDCQARQVLARHLLAARWEPRRFRQFARPRCDRCGDCREPEGGVRAVCQNNHCCIGGVYCGDGWWWSEERRSSALVATTARAIAPGSSRVLLTLEEAVANDRIARPSQIGDRLDEGLTIHRQSRHPRSVDRAIRAPISA